MQTSLPVLWIGQSEVETQIVLDMLDRIGFTDVVHECSSVGALNLLRIRQFGLVLCDLDVEPRNGLELLQSVRSSRDIGNVSFVLVTNNLSPDAVYVGKHLGADAVLLKPFSCHQLHGKLRALTKLSRWMWID